MQSPEEIHAELALDEIECDEVIAVLHRLQQLLLIILEGLNLFLTGAQLVVESSLILSALLVDALNLKVNLFFQLLLHLHGVL